LFFLSLKLKPRLAPFSERSEESYGLSMTEDDFTCTQRVLSGLCMVGMCDVHGSADIWSMLDHRVGVWTNAPYEW
jgi:hypothetical protein